MGDRLHNELTAYLEQLEPAGLLRRLRPLPQTGRLVEVDGKPLINLASNDYLGLSQHPRLKAAAIEAVERWGTGSGASRLVTGHLDLHAQVEQRFAAFKHAPAALLVPTGYMANLAVLTSLAGPGDLICLDRLNHASLIDAARASNAQIRTYPHLQTAKLARLLERHHQQAACSGGISGGGETSGGGDGGGGQTADRPPRRFIVTDSVFSMDGDCADLPALCDLAQRYNAILIVDEAHATGVLGPSGAGLCEEQGVQDRVHVVISTASKALGGLGGLITARQEVIDTIINTARPFIYTTAVPPAQAAAIAAALDVLRQEPQRRHRLLDMSRHLRRELTRLGWPLPGAPAPGSSPARGSSPGSTRGTPSEPPPTPIFPLIVGSAQAALQLAQHLQNEGILAVAIRPPTVPPGTARVRLSLRADLEDADLDCLIRALEHWTRRHTAA